MEDFNQFLIDEVRQELFSRLGHRTVHQNRINNDWTIKRFLIDKRLEFTNESDLVKAVSDAIESTLNWLDEHDIEHLDGSEFPKELYESGLILIDEKNKVCYVRGKVYQPISGWSPLVTKYIYFMINKFDMLCGTEGGTFVMDLRGAGLRNADINLCLDLMSTYVNYCPGLSKRTYLFEASWILKPLISSFRALMPTKYSKLIEFLSLSEAKKIFGNDNFPEFMGGNMKMVPKVPRECGNVSECGLEMGIEKSSIKKMNHILNQRKISLMEFVH